MELPQDQPDWVTCLARGEASEAALGALLEVASSLLKKARKKKGILQPRYVGIDATRWSADAEQDLAHEFFCHLLEKRPELEASARAGELGEGYVYRIVVNWLEDRRRQADPVGAAGYRKLQASVQEEIAVGALRLLDGGDRFDKHSRLEVTGVGLGREADVDLLRAAVRSYSDSATLRGQFTKEGRGATRALRGLWPHLLQSRIRTFVLGDLLAALLPDPAGPDREVERIPRTDLPVSDPVARALELIAASGLPDTSRGLLATFLDRLQDARDPRKSTSDGWEFNAAEVGRAMGLPRQRAHELLVLLRRVLGPLARELDIDPDAQGGRPSSHS